jgi:DNA mismatch endonuclease (patch repair protein)
MADTLTTRQRSLLMARIKSRGNRSTELRLIQIFREFGIKGWRRNLPLAGSPDFVFPKFKVAVFVDGCFWHGCPMHGEIPQSNTVFWRNKISANKRRDRRAGKLLRKMGWKVVRVWEHSTRPRNRKAVHSLATRMLRNLKHPHNDLTILARSSRLA